MNQTTTRNTVIIMMMMMIARATQLMQLSVCVNNNIYSPSLLLSLSHSLTISAFSLCLYNFKFQSFFRFSFSAALFFVFLSLLRLLIRFHYHQHIIPWNKLNWIETKWTINRNRKKRECLSSNENKLSLAIDDDVDDEEDSSL